MNSEFSNVSILNNLRNGTSLLNEEFLEKNYNNDADLLINDLKNLTFITKDEEFNSFKFRYKLKFSCITQCHFPKDKEMMIYKLGCKIFLNQMDYERIGNLLDNFQDPNLGLVLEKLADAGTDDKNVSIKILSLIESPNPGNLKDLIEIFKDITNPLEREYLREALLSELTKIKPHEKDLLLSTIGSLKVVSWIKYQTIVKLLPLIVMINNQEAIHALAIKFAEGLDANGLQGLYFLHNQLLTSLLDSEKIEKMLSVSRFARYDEEYDNISDEEINELKNLIRLYYKDPENLKLQLIHANPTRKTEIEAGFQKLEYLRKLIDFGKSCPENTNLSNCGLIDSKFTDDFLKFCESITPKGKIEVGKEGKLYKKKRAAFSIYAYPYFDTFKKVYFQKFAMTIDDGEEWQKEIMTKVADILIHKFSEGDWKKLTPHEQIDIKDAIIHSKIFLMDSIEVMSSWIPKDDGSYAISNNKKLRTLELWYSGLF